MRFLILILIIPFVSANILVSEIMYNPSEEQGADKDLEWVEFYSDEEINLNEFYLYNSKLSNQTVKDYFVIVRNESAFLSYYKINTNVVETKFILSNKGGYINLTNLNQSYLVSYDNRLANGNSKTIEFKNNLPYESLYKGGTPGEENSIVTVKEYDLKISEFMADPEEGGEWVEIHSNEKADLNGYYFTDSSNRTIPITDISGGTEITSYLVVSFHNSKLLNNDGDEIKLLSPLNNIIDKVSYSSSKKGFSWSIVNGKWILTEPSPGKENYERAVAEDSFLAFDKINKTNFGSILNIEVNIYKGATDKKSVYLYIENLTKRTKVNVIKKFSNYSFSLPLFIDPNCDYKFKNGSYPLILDGLGTQYRGFIEIEGINQKLCRSEIIESNDCGLTETNLNEKEVIYESKDIKAGRAALLFFCSLLVLIIMIQLKDGR